MVRLIDSLVTLTTRTAELTPDVVIQLMPVLIDAANSSVTLSLTVDQVGPLMTVLDNLHNSYMMSQYRVVMYGLEYSLYTPQQTELFYASSKSFLSLYNQVVMNDMVVGRADVIYVSPYFRAISRATTTSHLTLSLPVSDMEKCAGFLANNVTMDNVHSSADNSSVVLSLS
eukprot:gene18691-23895_t